MVVDINPGTRLDQLELRAQLLGLPHPRAGFHAKRLGRIAGGDHARRVRHHRQNGHGLASQARIFLLFAGGEKRIKIHS